MLERSIIELEFLKKRSKNKHSARFQGKAFKSKRSGIFKGNISSKRSGMLEMNILNINVLECPNKERPE